MAYKDKEKQQKFQKQWYQNNKKKHSEAGKERRKKTREWLRDYKSKLKCNRCDEDHPSCMQFHHIDPSQKELNIRGAVRANWSIERIQLEIEKCEVLCANCHFKEHWRAEST